MEWATTEKYDGCVMMAVDATHHRLSVADAVEQQTLHPEFLVFYFHDSDTNHATDQLTHLASLKESSVRKIVAGSTLSPKRPLVTITYCRSLATEQ